MAKKLCNYLIEANITNGSEEDNTTINKAGETVIKEWNDCRRLGTVRQKTCEKCAFNIKNKELMAKAKRYYRVVR